MIPLDFIESVAMSKVKKPHAGFRIAFNMLDADGREMMDKREFMVLEEVFCKKNDKKERGESDSSSQLNVELYGFRCSVNHALDCEEPYASHRFMDNLQTEVLEIEFPILKA